MSRRRRTPRPRPAEGWDTRSNRTRSARTRQARGDTPCRNHRSPIETADGHVCSSPPPGKSHRCRAAALGPPRAIALDDVQRVRRNLGHRLWSAADQQRLAAAAAGGVGGGGGGLPGGGEASASSRGGGRHRGQRWWWRQGGGRGLARATAPASAMRSRCRRRRETGYCKHPHGLRRGASSTGCGALATRLPATFRMRRTRSMLVSCGATSGSSSCCWDAGSRS